MLRLVTAPMIYVSFPGNAREDLGFFEGIFGGKLFLYTNKEFGNSDAPPEAIAHGELQGTVSVAGSDTSPGDKSVKSEGLMLSLLGTARPTVLHSWFDQLADGGHVEDPLAPKPWGAPDGQVIDRYCLHWLIGYEPAS